MSSLKNLSIPLQLILIVPFVLQIFAAVGLVGYFSFRNGQKAIHQLAIKLMGEIDDGVNQQLNFYLAVPHQINQINADAAQSRILNLQDPETTGHYFWQQMQVHKNLSYIFYALPTGEYSAAGRWEEGGNIVIDEVSPRTNYQSYSYSTDLRGNRQQLIYKAPYQPLSEDWYIQAVKSGKPIWSNIYNWDGSPDVISISAALPVYDDRQQLIAVMGVDFQLSNISYFLHKLKASQMAKIVILERDGNIVASSSSERPFTIVGKRAKRLKAAASTDPLIRSLAANLQKKFGNFHCIKAGYSLNMQFEGKQYHTLVNPWQDKYGLDWLIVVAIPESDLMAQIDANTRTTIVLCFTALAFATILGIYTSRWITRPILKLQQATVAIASGELDRSVDVKGIREIEGLARSFNEMASQLKTSFTELEDRVAERTEALQQANQKLLQLASSDELTQIANRRHFNECLKKEWHRHLREQKFLALILIDIDYFKFYNDSYGHQCGDECLFQVAQAIDRFPKRAADLVARYGGEEFVVILPNTPPEGALKCAELLRTAVLSLAIPHAKSAVSPYVTLSLGVAALIPTSDNKPENLIAEADEALYQAKKLGRNQSYLRGDSQGKVKPTNIDLKDGADRIKSLSNSLGNFSYSVGDIKQPFNLHEGIDSSLLILADRVRANEHRPAIKVVTEYGQIPEITCFPEQLNQVFLNILANAIDALEESNQGRSFSEIKASPNRITIRTQMTNDKCVTIGISDNGIGMTEEVKQQIFDRLFTTKAVGRGTGLGMAIAKSIVVEKHGGRINVNSTLGGGSEFEIVLPITE
ncbi:diguanylate cyclase [Microcoleus sp. Pol11C1]|uniref:diguanylate cyclase domain-containing protein n=1 Tax=unclassified Microcoleus TaxID=2642155 RepID=UPI002FD3566F